MGFVVCAEFTPAGVEIADGTPGTGYEMWCRIGEAGQLSKYKTAWSRIASPLP
jgi:hypothetical protein